MRKLLIAYVLGGALLVGSLGYILTSAVAHLWQDHKNHHAILNALTQRQPPLPEAAPTKQGVEK